MTPTIQTAGISFHGRPHNHRQHLRGHLDDLAAAAALHLPDDLRKPARIS